MTNDFNNISAESNLRDEITMTPNETMFDETDRHDDIDPNEETYDEGENYDNEGTVNDEPDDSMDGDFDSGMASAGFGTDEDYGYYGDGEE